MRGRAWLGEAAFYLLAAAMLGALVHFMAILILPLVAERDAYSRLAAIGAVGTTIALPTAEPTNRGLPYQDPAVATAFCRYDLADGPIRVREPIGRAGFASLSFHSRRGVVFYALTDRAATHGLMDAVIVTGAQLRALVARDDEDNPSEDLRIVSPTADGFVMTRVFSELPSLYPAATVEAQTLACTPEPLPK